MNILITGANGFVGKNLTCALENIRDGKDRTRPSLSIEKVYCCTRSTTKAELEQYCSEADFVFHLAGVNRPKDPAEFMQGNCDFTASLLDALRKAGSKAPVLLSSSIQATLTGRYADGEYGKSKLAGEELLFTYAQNTGNDVFVYRFPNLFGKWCRPNYNSAVATFCNAFANDLPYTVNDPSTQLELLYIDDLIEEILNALEGHPHRCSYPRFGETVTRFSDGSSHSVVSDGLTAFPDNEGRYCFVPVTHKVTLGEIIELLKSFCSQPNTLLMPSIPEGSFSKKLYSTYLSYLPAEKARFALKMNTDDRGSFTELLKTADHGQFSVNISKPGITKGQHWHNTKWEFFIVVSGTGLIEMRKIGSSEVLRYKVSGKEIEAVHMLPGYTHNIINLSDTEDLVTVMWANESFDPSHPDTFSEKV